MLPQQLNGPVTPRPSLDLKAAGPFPWQHILWTILGTVLPVFVKWLGDALSPAASPNTDQNTNPPA